jgi:hypothetical protein
MCMLHHNFYCIFFCYHPSSKPGDRCLYRSCHMTCGGVQQITTELGGVVSEPKILAITKIAAVEYLHLSHASLKRR